jgi:hypothetical protein
MATGAFTVSHRILVVLVVTFLSACGASARSPAAPSATAADSRATSRAEPNGAVPESNPADDYVVGPFVTSSGENGAGVRTYYIVRN